MSNGFSVLVFWRRSGWAFKLGNCRSSANYPNIHDAQLGAFNAVEAALAAPEMDLRELVESIL